MLPVLETTLTAFGTRSSRKATPKKSDTQTAPAVVTYSQDFEQTAIVLGENVQEPADWQAQVRP
jgi:hypothetical protein